MVTIEEGGFGAESAAPAAKEILEAYFHKQLTKDAKGGEAEGSEAAASELEAGHG